MKKNFLLTSFSFMLAAAGKPGLPDGIEVQILDHVYTDKVKVSGGTSIEPQKGFLCLESEGSPIQFRKLRVRELP